MLKIWNAAFWNETAAVPVLVEDRRWVAMTGVVAVLTLLSLGIGFGAEPVFRIARVAADRALDQAGYVNAVFAHHGKGAPLPAP
jgi:formate hydrogenlyase subunit 3/multisubunit Na+/H+ antiporter MnhD subunit